MQTKTFNVVSTISMAFIPAVAILSLIGVAITGLYPGIGVLCFMALIPIASKFFANRISDRSNGFRQNYYKTLTVVNVLSILVVVWMTFVILVDRVFSKIL